MKSIVHAEGVRIKRRIKMFFKKALLDENFIFICFADPVEDVAILRSFLHSSSDSVRGMHRFLSDVHPSIQ